MSRSIETHEVLVITTYFLRTPTPSHCTNLTQCATWTAKGQILQLPKERKTLQDVYVGQILQTGLKPCYRRWSKASILFDIFKSKKSPRSVCVLPLEYRGRVFTCTLVRERSGWQRGLKLDCSAPKVICGNSLCVSSPIEEHCSKQEWERFQLEI